MRTSFDPLFTRIEARLRSCGAIRRHRGARDPVGTKRIWFVILWLPALLLIAVSAPVRCVHPAIPSRPVPSPLTLSWHQGEALRA